MNLDILVSIVHLLYSSLIWSFAFFNVMYCTAFGFGGLWIANSLELFLSEWIDFPRANRRLPDGRVIPGNNFSYDKCRRRFDLVSLFGLHM